MSLPLNTDLPLRLIGIQLFEQTKRHIRKSLPPGWYPFIQTKEDIGVNKSKRPMVSEEACPPGFYSIEDGLPRVTVTAIAGKNGSGKSSLLDILYRILNNFAAAMFSQEPGGICEEVHLTKGLYARLFFEQDGVQRYIDVADERVSYFEYNENVEEEQKLYALSDKERNDLLNRFFYTISINYSIYSFQPSDYSCPLGVTEGRDSYGGEWLDYLFHKNDGYYIPLVLTPFRTGGEMETANENVLAEQRISVLSLLYHSQKKGFLEGYEPYRLCYEFNEDYKTIKLRSFRQKIQEELKPCLDIILEHFTQGWQRYFDENEIELDKGREEIELFYFAYKAVKICLTYPEYVALFQLDDLLSLAKSYRELYAAEGMLDMSKKKGGLEQIIVSANDCINWMSHHTKNVKDVIEAIVHDPGRHITSKLFQSINYLKGPHYKQGTSIKVAELIDHRYDTYSEVMNIMPPPFFRSELHYRKTNDKKQNPEEITLNYLSSGEKQLLNSISYICYHIKNIASNRKDGKRVVGYHHVNIVFDEAELYYHPEFQRVFVKRLLERLAMCHINRTNLRSVNIIIVTHSPFILSDIPNGNVLYLGVNDGHKPGNTFGANIYDLLQDSFFLSSDIGELALSKIDEMMTLYYLADSEDRKKAFEEKYDEFEFIMNHIGEAYLRKTYTYMFERLQEQYKPQKAKAMWQRRLFEIEVERGRINALLEK